MSRRGSGRRRYKILKEGKYVCAVCGSLNRKELTLDHIVPKAIGGSNSSRNLLCLCFHCNQLKANKLPLTWLNELSIETKNRLENKVITAFLSEFGWKEKVLFDKATRSANIRKERGEKRNER